MAGDDDDEGFGDFTFASFPNINGHNSTTTDDDDNWGDFVEYPLRSETPKPVDPFGFFSDHSMEPSQSIGSATTQWVKPKGALPLSIFGDAENEEESGAVDQSVVDKNAGNIKKESNVHLGVGINDIIANLYSQSKQIMAQNALNSNSNGTNSEPGVVNLNMNGSNSNSDLDIFTNPYTQGHEVRKENGVISNSNTSSSNLKGMNSDFNGFNITSDSIGGNEESDGDDDGWEFKDAYVEPKVREGNDKGPVLSELSGLEVQSKLKIGQEMQVDLKVHEISAATTYSSGFSNGSHGAIDLFVSSNGASSEPHEMDIGFDFKSSTVAENGFVSDSFSQSEQNGIENGLNSHPQVGIDDSGESFGEFEGFSETGSKQEEEPKFGNLSSSEVKASALDGKNQVDPKVQEISKATTPTPVFSNGSHGPIDLFATSNGTSSKSHEMDIGFDFKSSIVAGNGFISDSYFQSVQNGIENGLNSRPHDGIAHSDESFGESKAGFSETGSKQEGNEIRSENQKGPVPLSIFGDEELETDSSLNFQDGFMFKQASSVRNVQSQGSNLSISDLVSNLYSQAEPIHSVDSMQKPTEIALDPTNGDSNLMDGEDDFDDGSWEFKDAVSQTGAKDQTSLILAEPHQKHSTKTELNGYVDFYCKLKDQLCFVARYHLDNIKKARSTAAISGEHAKVAALDDEIQEACKELHEENVISKGAHSGDHPPRDICLREFLELLHEPKFQVLESEYQLSRKLSIAENDLRSTIELVKHATTMLKILTLVSLEEQSSYVSAWSKMLSVCAQELKHGVWIWRQSLEKNVQSQILSKPQGKRFLLSLGEIYRVVAVLGASVKLYKPWILSNSVDSAAISALLDESHTLWSSSGLEEAFPSICDSVGSEYDTTVNTLLESMKHIRDLDVLALGNVVFAQQESLCRLSILTPGVVPDMKMVVWDGEQYFLTLANLWGNMISCDPPKLPCLHVG